jgi:hypothetical protein
MHGTKHPRPQYSESLPRFTRQHRWPGYQPGRQLAGPDVPSAASSPGSSGGPTQQPGRRSAASRRRNSHESRRSLGNPRSPLASPAPTGTSQALAR